ncbi:ABC transporter permease [Paenibacillus piri]|uniref:Sugar ABC transporter permease n=1 Tax=Paenibacillus piri TaxID=2547395 RepID=A0A4V2ZTX2_9BACL|nr:ABC transporter permease subunit [Paenibacillus piri]TDF98704.1 sugar ABC transporter permease [Paenibacillus piri]
MNLGQPIRNHLHSAYRSRYYLLMLLPGLIYYLVFHYAPIYGVLIAFKEFNIFEGIWGSPWAPHYGMQQFLDLFQSPDFYIIFRNTVLLSVYTIVFSFPMPIVLALSLNEVVSPWWKRTVQSISYLPHFISTVVISGMVFNFVSLNGMVNQIAGWFGFEHKQFLLMPGYFRTIFVTSDIWQTIGWGSILYLAALAAVDPQLYESAKIDGANRWHRILYINVPALIPTAVVLLIFQIGGIMNASYEKVLLLYNPNVYETADVIGTYVYRRGIVGAEFSFTAAAGLFQSVIGFGLVVIANYAARRFSSSSLW